MSYLGMTSMPISPWSWTNADFNRWPKAKLCVFSQSLYSIQLKSQIREDDNETPYIAAKPKGDHQAPMEAKSTAFR